MRDGPGNVFALPGLLSLRPSLEVCMSAVRFGDPSPGKLGGGLC